MSITSQAQYVIMRELALRMIYDGDDTPMINECKLLEVDFDAVSSLFNQLFVRQLKIDAKRGIDWALQAAIRAYSAERGSEIELISEDKNDDHNSKNITLRKISKDYRIGGYKLVKIYLETIYDKTVSLSQFLDNPELVVNTKIRTDLLLCMGSDAFCSLPCEQLKECVGREYEELLIERLNLRRMCFETEAELRSRGKPKTPDILFLIPMATPHCNNPSRGMVVVNWIDSKAMFADQDTLAEHLEQLTAYTNRYGRGLVIYWHGYVEGIAASALRSTDDMIMISNNFPDHWVFPTGEVATGGVPAFDDNNNSC